MTLTLSQVRYRFELGMKLLDVNAGVREKRVKVVSNLREISEGGGDIDLDSALCASDLVEQELGGRDCGAEAESRVSVRGRGLRGERESERL